MDILPLTPDEVLTTTRAVRKRLDLGRPVEREVIEQCLRIAQQAPTGSLNQGWHFVVVTDPAKRAALAGVYRRGWEMYVTSNPLAYPNRRFADAARAAPFRRMHESSEYLAQHLHAVPVHVIPCTSPRPENRPFAQMAGMFGGILPAAWSFMLAARARGLGTVLTTLHLYPEGGEGEAARLLGIPHETVAQVALIPVAYAKGTDFQPAFRDALQDIVHWDAW